MSNQQHRKRNGLLPPEPVQWALNAVDVQAAYMRVPEGSFDAAVPQQLLDILDLIFDLYYMVLNKNK